MRHHILKRLSKYLRDVSKARFALLLVAVVINNIPYLSLN